MKKYLLNIGAFISVLAPVVAVVSCKKVQDSASNDKNENKAPDKDDKVPDKGKENTIISVGKNNKTISKTFGLENYSNPSVTNLDSRNMSEHKNRIATGKSFAPHFHPRDIADWGSKKSDEGAYIRSSVPLAKRGFAIENITSNKNNARYYGMETMRASTSWSAVGTLPKGDKESQIIQGLQYMTDMIIFGGSVSEGIVYIPRAQDIDAYHRMGIKVHATLFFGQNGSGTTAQDYKDLIGGDPEKAADKLVRMAKYYGFDGWFINDENLPPSGWTTFMKTWHKKAKAAGIEISYYANNNFGPVYKAGSDAYDVWFNDYGVPQGGSADGSNKPKGFSEFTHPLGYNPSSIRSGKGQSFWLYRPWENGSYYKNEKNVRTFYNGVDASKKIITDPRLSTDDSLSKYYREYTPFISHKSFSTSFNKGEGNFFNVNGTAIKSKFFDAGYSNMSLQDYLPTWKYIIDVAGLDGVVDESKIGKSGISVDHKETSDAWFGSDALVYNGIIEKNKMITNKLFASNIKLEEKDNFSIMYKGDVIPSLAVWTKEGENFKSNILDGKSDDAIFLNKYHRVAYDLSSLKGKQMTSFGIAIKNNIDKKLDLNNFVLGKVSFNVKSNKEASAPKLNIRNLVNGGEWLLPGGKNIRLKWETNNENIKGYFIYKNNDKFNNKELIGIANTPATLLKGLDMEKISHISIIPFNNNDDVFSEIKVNINGGMLDFGDDSKWTKKILPTNDYGYRTGRGFVGKALDKEGGTYLVNNGVQLMHINKYGVLEKDGDYKQIIFEGKPNKGRHRNQKGSTFSTLFIGKNKRIFIGRRYSGNGLYVFDKGMKEVDNEWLKFKDDNSIFKGQDNNGEMEYVAKIIQQEDGSLVLISSLGNLKKISKNGILDKTFNKTFDASNKKEIAKISTIKLGKKIIINYHFVDNNGINVFEKEMDENGAISNSTADSKLGYILDNKETKGAIVISTLCLVGNHFEVFIKVYDKTKGKIISSAKINIDSDGNSILLQDDYYNAFTLSTDGKYLIFRDRNHRSNKRPYMKKFVLDSSYILVVSIDEILKNSSKPILIKSIFVKHSIEEVSGHKKSYGGDFKVITAIDGLIYYGTSDSSGRVGAIKIDYGNLDNASLVKVKSVIYKFTKPDGSKMTTATIETFKKGNNFPKNPKELE